MQSDVSFFVLDNNFMLKVYGSVSCRLTAFRTLHPAVDCLGAVQRWTIRCNRRLQHADCRSTFPQTSSSMQLQLLAVSYQTRTAVLSNGSHV
jgi:hypothetical protein